MMRDTEVDTFARLQKCDPLFPIVIPSGPASTFSTGISERRYIAMTVMPAIIAKLPMLHEGDAGIPARHQLVARSALAYADALIAADGERAE